MTKLNGSIKEIEMLYDIAKNNATPLKTLPIKYDDMFMSDRFVLFAYINGYTHINNIPIIIKETNSLNRDLDVTEFKLLENVIFFDYCKVIVNGNVEVFPVAEDVYDFCIDDFEKLILPDLIIHCGELKEIEKLLAYHCASTYNYIDEISKELTKEILDDCINSVILYRKGIDITLFIDKTSNAIKELVDCY